MENNGTQNQQAAQNQQAQNQATNQAQNQAQNQQAQQSNAGTAVDYQKIQQMLDGTLKAKEETALKAYFNLTDTPKMVYRSTKTNLSLL